MLFLVFLRHHCVHDDLQSRCPVHEAPSGKGIKSSEYSPIRIKFDFTFIDGSDSFKCLSSGQNITWGGYTYQCTAEDVSTTEKNNVVKNTFLNLSTFLTQFIKVKPHTADIIPEPWSGTADVDQTPVSGYDMVVFVYARPFGSGSNTLASATYNLAESSLQRPIHGFIFINYRVLPDQAESRDSLENDFFHTCFHEMLHAFGISHHSFSNWRDSNGVKYDPFPISKLYKGNKVFEVIHTPECHKYAVNRFGTNIFANQTHTIPSGVEIEDGGGSGTARSHPEARVYLNEVMVGMSVGTPVISDLSLALLIDTGWYQVNYSYARGLAWGNGRTYYNNPIPDFAIGSPQTAFPPHYLCTPSNISSVCNYDYSGVGLCQSTNVDCGTDTEFCSNNDFYNPKSYSIRGIYQTHDYMLFVVPYSNRICKKNSVKMYSQEEFGERSRCFHVGSSGAGCFNTRCDNNRLFVTVSGVEKECEYAKQALSFSGITLNCPELSEICLLDSIAKNLPENPYIYLPDQTPSPTLPQATPQQSPAQSPIPRTPSITNTQVPLRTQSYDQLALGLSGLQIGFGSIALIFLLFCICMCSCKSSSKNRRQADSDSSYS